MCIPLLLDSSPSTETHEFRPLHKFWMRCWRSNCLVAIESFEKNCPKWNIASNPLPNYWAHAFCDPDFFHCVKNKAFEWLFVYTYLEPKWPLFWRSTPQNKAELLIKTKVIWVPGTYINTLYSTNMAPCPAKRKMSFSKPFDWRSSPCLKTSSPRESAYHPQNYLCLFNPIFFGLRGSESPEKNVQNHDPGGPTSGECWSIELTINCRFANDATVKKQQSRVKRQAKGGPETLPPWNGT